MKCITINNYNIGCDVDDRHSCYGEREREREEG